jgi:hypothetical protein
MPETMTKAECVGESKARTWCWSLVRGFSGAVTASMVLLLLAVIGAQIYFQVRGYPGIGWGSVVVHAVAALLAVILQRAADERTGVVSALASLGVIAEVAAVLWIFWWA